jgi:hypothetical protein
LSTFRRKIHRVIHEAKDADLSKFVYNQVYVSQDSRFWLNGDSVFLKGGSKINVLVKEISKSFGVFLLGEPIRYIESFNKKGKGVPFIILVKTDNVGTSLSNQFTIPTTGTGYNYIIEWGDGNINVGVTGDITHTYAIAGTYQIRIYGQFPRIFFNNSGDRLKLLEIQQWGEIVWGSFGNAFWGCSNMDITATDVPILTNVNNYASFIRLSGVNQNLGSWLINPNMTGSFNNALNNSAMSTANYTDTIVGWANTIFNQGGLPTNRTMLNQAGRTFQNSRSGGANFADAQAARDYLVTTLGWTITGDTIIA